MLPLQDGTSSFFRAYSRTGEPIARRNSDDNTMSGTLQYVLIDKGYTPARSISQQLASGTHSTMILKRGGSQSVMTKAPVIGNVRHMSGCMSLSTISDSPARPAMRMENEVQNNVSRHHAARMRPGSRTGSTTFSSRQAS